MTKQEAINLLVNATYSEEWQGNEELTEANHIAIECVEKQIPKRPNITKFGVDGFISWICPSCGASARQENIEIYCHNCGQAIDWSEEDD